MAGGIDDGIDEVAPLALPALPASVQSGVEPEDGLAAIGSTGGGVVAGGA